MKLLALLVLILSYLSANHVNSIPLFNRKLIHLNGGAVTPPKEQKKCDVDSQIMMRVQFPNTKIEKLYFNGTEPISNIVMKLKDYANSDSSLENLDDFTIIVKGKKYSPTELIQLTDQTISSQSYRQGEWIVLEKVNLESITRSRKQMQQKKPTTFSSLSDMKKYKNSLIKYQPDDNNENSGSISIHFSTNLHASVGSIISEGGVSLLFGKVFRNSTSTTSGNSSLYYQVLGSYPLFQGHLLSSSSGSTSAGDQPFTLTRLQQLFPSNSLLSLQDILETLNLEILGIAISTPIESLTSSNNDQEGVTFLQNSRWNKIMVFTAHYLFTVFKPNNELVVLSLAPNEENKLKNLSKTLTPPGKRKEKQNNSISKEIDPFSMKAYRLHKQIAAFFNQSILAYELMTDDENKKGLPPVKQVSSSSDWKNLTFTQPILFLSQECQSIDSSFFAVPLLITPESSIPPDVSNILSHFTFKALSPFQLPLPGKSQTKNHLYQSKDSKQGKILVRILRTMLTRLLASQSSGNMMKMNEESKLQEEEITLLREFRDVSFLFYLQKLIFPSSSKTNAMNPLFKKFLEEFVSIKEEDWNNLNEILFPSLIHKKKPKTNKSDGKVGKFRNVSKEILLQFQLFLSSLPKEKIIYDGEKPASKTHNDDEDEDDEL